MTAVPERLREAIRSSAFRQGEFQLPNGGLLHEYFDQYAMASDPVLLRQVAHALEPLLPPEAEVLVGLELGGVPLAVALSAVSGVPAAFVRRSRKTHGTRRQIEGRLVHDRIVVVVDDVVRTGGQLADAVDTLRQEAASVSGAVCVIDRALGAAERLAAMGVPLRTLMTVQQ